VGVFSATAGAVAPVMCRVCSAATSCGGDGSDDVTRVGSTLGLATLLGFVRAVPSAPLLALAQRALTRRAAELDEGHHDGTCDLGVSRGEFEPRVLDVHPHLCVLWKPAGWTLRATFGEGAAALSTCASVGQELQDWLSTQSANPIARDVAAQHGLLHRLDRDTTGALLWACSYRGYYACRVQFALGRVRKGYLLLCEGSMAPTMRPLTSPLRELPPDATGPARSVAGAGGRPALTQLVCVGHLVSPDTGRVSLVHAWLCTGRQHQLRVHLANEGHPLVADAVYGGNASSWCSRLLLHAQSVRVDGGDEVSAVDCVAALPQGSSKMLALLTPLDARARWLLRRE